MAEDKSQQGASRRYKKANAAPPRTCSGCWSGRHLPQVRQAGGIANIAAFRRFERESLVNVVLIFDKYGRGGWSVSQARVFESDITGCAYLTGRPPSLVFRIFGRKLVRSPAFRRFSSLGWTPCDLDIAVVIP